MTTPSILPVCFDTSAFIHLENEAGLSFDQAYGLVAPIIEAGQLFTPNEVLNELIRQDSQFADVVNALDPANRLIRPQTIATVQQVVLATAPGLIDPYVANAAEDADPYVVAVGYIKHVTVVHKEVRQHERNSEEWPGRKRIPDVTDLLVMDELRIEEWVTAHP